MNSGFHFDIIFNRSWEDGENVSLQARAVNTLQMCRLSADIICDACAYKFYCNVEVYVLSLNNILSIEDMLVCDVSQVCSVAVTSR